MSKFLNISKIIIYIIMIFSVEPVYNYIISIGYSNIFGIFLIISIIVFAGIVIGLFEKFLESRLSVNKISESTLE